MQIHLLPDKASLSKLRRLIRGDLVRAGVSPAAVFDCLVAVTDACGEVLTSPGADDASPARVWWEIDRRRARFTIEGRPLEDAGAARRRIAEVLERESVLEDAETEATAALMDEVSIEDGDGVRRTTLVKRLR